MDYGINSLAGENLIQCTCIQYVALDEGGIARGFTVSRREIVEHGDAMASVQQIPDQVRSDITGTTTDEDMTHGLPLSSDGARISLG
jgi:hypothetical protein